MPEGSSLTEKVGQICFIDSRFMAPSLLEDAWEKDGFSVTGTLNIGRKGIPKKEIKKISEKLKRGPSPSPTVTATRLNFYVDVDCQFVVDVHVTTTDLDPT